MSFRFISYPLIYTHSKFPLAAPWYVGLVRSDSEYCALLLCTTNDYIKNEFLEKLKIVVQKLWTITAQKVLAVNLLILQI